MKNKHIKIKYIFTFPFVMDIGGGGKIIKDITRKLKTHYTCEYLDMETTELDFDTLIVFGCTYLNPHMLKFYKENGVKVILYPIFDRMKPVWQMKAFKWLNSFPIMNIYSLRNDIFTHVDHIIVANESEKRDLAEIYNVDEKRMSILHYGISDNLFTLSKKKRVSQFGKKHKEYVFCPAAAITDRKGQVRLIQALKGTGITLVLNNTHKIHDGLESEFKKLTEGDENIICLKELTDEELIDIYKGASVSVSVSKAETAGLVNLEAGLNGCNLVVSDLEALREYLGEYAEYVDHMNIDDIRSKVQIALQKDEPTSLIEYVKKHCTWDSYIDSLVDIIHSIEK